MSPRSTPTAPRVRREPPAFRCVEVVGVARLSPYMVLVTLAGPALAGLTVELPGASMRLLLPSDGAGEMVIPVWQGNEFLLPDGSRPALRTLTPLRLDGEALELDVAVVIHGSGPLSEWADSAEPGALAALSGPGRGYAIDSDAPAFLLAGDETAIPAIGQLLPLLPATSPVVVHIEVARPDARVALPAHPRATILWWDLPPGAAPGEALFTAVSDCELHPGVGVWAAGEAAGMQRIRRHLFEERGLSRAQATVRGYWKHGRRGDAGEDA